MKRAVRFLALTATLFVAAALAAEPRQATMIQDVVAGEAHEKGEARWNSVVFSQLSDVCRLVGPDRKIELGKKADPEPRANAADCVATIAWIHNTSQRPIYCRAVLKLRQPDDSGRKEIAGKRLVMPDAMVSLATAYGQEANAPSKAFTECKVKDVAPPPQPRCEFKIIRAADPGSFYPADSRRREEEGDVVLDFRVDPAAQKPRNIRVSESSGYRSLDLAALKVGRMMQVTETCPDNRRKVKVKFRIQVETEAPAS